MTNRVMSDESVEVPLQVTYAGSAPVYTIKLEGVTTITNDETLLMYVYKGSTDVTSTYTTGSMSVSGNTITTKTFQSLVGGDQLYVTIFCTADGIKDCRCAFWLKVKKLTGR